MAAALDCTVVVVVVMMMMMMMSRSDRDSGWMLIVDIQKVKKHD